MSKPYSLDQIISVKSRFARSMSLVRDFESPDALEGYILTPVGRDVLHRLLAALGGSSSTRAWSVTGPYGTGKSSFALFAAQLLAADSRIRDRALRITALPGSDACRRVIRPGIPPGEENLAPFRRPGERKPPTAGKGPGR